MTAWEEQMAMETSPVGAVMPGQQGSPEWLMARVGKVTASRFSDVMNFRKDGKESAKRYDYRMELVVERLTGQPSEHYVSEYMEWGTEQEAAARMAYEAHTGYLVIVPGFINHPTIPMCGGSPDGLVDDDGMVEFKAPASVTHIETILAATCEHIPQVQGNLSCSPERAWCDFVSYDPRLPKHLRLYVQRVARDVEIIKRLDAGVTLFQSELDALMERLQRTGKEREPDEVATLLKIDKAKDADEATEILAACAKLPFAARAAKAFNNRWVRPE